MLRNWLRFFMLCLGVLLNQTAWADEPTAGEDPWTQKIDPYIMGSMIFRAPGTCCDFSLQLGVRYPVEEDFFFALASGIGITERGNSSVHLAFDMLYQLEWHSLLLGVGPYLEILSLDGFTSYEQTWNVRFSGYFWNIRPKFSLGVQMLLGQYTEYVIVHDDSQSIGVLLKRFSFAGGIFALYDF